MMVVVILESRISEISNSGSSSQDWWVWVWKWLRIGFRVAGSKMETWKLGVQNGDCLEVIGWLNGGSGTSNSCGPRNFLREFIGRFESWNNLSLDCAWLPILNTEPESMGLTGSLVLILSFGNVFLSCWCSSSRSVTIMSICGCKVISGWMVRFRW